jgi:hypothetical protein
MQGTNTLNSREKNDGFFERVLLRFALADADLLREAGSLVDEISTGFSRDGLMEEAGTTTGFS